MNSIGTIHRQKGNLKLAQQFHENALNIARQIDDRRLQSNALGHIGNVRKDSGKLDLALDSFQQQLDLSGQIGYKRGEGRAFWNMSLILSQTENFPEALSNAEKALQIYEKLNHPFADQIQAQIIKWKSSG